ncbi:hypothetical protein FA95DRAFT_1206301 [Auriscalpium vulgare]|uniref:Uncharacterized protein n=1 Tax=Auriscalpium vulgare TaxID=40419 RepID=A0ACB8RTW6_9AGAM|nr:hypothetical protein FA95DRAFT_1206301 [Auriscalpium vulgare]
MATDSVLVLLAVHHRHWPARSSCGSHHTRAPTRLPNIQRTVNVSRNCSLPPEPRPTKRHRRSEEKPMLRPNLHGACTDRRARADDRRPRPRHGPVFVALTADMLPLSTISRSFTPADKRTLD